MGSTVSHWVDNASYFYHVVKMIKVEQGKHVFPPYQLICSGVYVCVYVQEIGICVCRIVLADACMCIWQPEVNFRDHFSGVTHLKVSCFHCTCECALVHIWRSGDALQELILSFHPVGPGDQT